MELITNGGHVISHTHIIKPQKATEQWGWRAPGGHTEGAGRPWELGPAHALPTRAGMCLPELYPS